MKEVSKCLAEVVEVRRLTDDVREIGLKLINPPELHFTGGQYITIEIEEMKNGHPRLNNRPYSIASPPSDTGMIRLCVDRVGEGPGSTYLHALMPGDRLAFLSPIGYFTVSHDRSTPLLFVATGTGIAPIKSMIGDILQRGNPVRPITLYWGLRREEDLYYQEELAEWAGQHLEFQYVTTLSQPSATWQGMRGRVTDHLQKVMTECRFSFDNIDAYLCGNFEMIKEVRTMLMEQGIEKKAIHFEKFY